MKFFNRKNRRFQYGVLSTVFTIIVVIALFVLNAIVGELSERLELTLDLTENNIYELSEETTEYLKGLEQDIAIHVLADEAALVSSNAYMVQLHHTLENYGNSKHISLDYINLTLKPTYLSRYPDYDLKENDVIVECGERIRILHLNDMLQTETAVNYTTYTSTVSINASIAEQLLTNAIMFVSAEELISVSMLTGYSNVPTDAMVQLLEHNSFLVEEQSLIMEEINPEATAAILYGLQSDISEEILSKLDTWMDNGGKQGKTLLIFLDSNVGELPNVNAFLKEWGMALENKTAIETEAARYYYYPYYPVAQYTDDTFAGKLAESDNPVIMALTMPLKIVDTTANYVVTPLLSLSETAGIMDRDGRISQAKEPVHALLLSTHTYYGTETNTSCVALSGSYQAFSSTLLSDSTFSNAEYLLGVVNKLTGREEALQIAAKDFSVAKHSLNNRQIEVRAFIFIGFLPLCMLGTGIVVWLLRRRS